MKGEFSDFLTQFNAKLIPLSKKANIAYFKATISGADADYAKAADLELQMSRLFANKEDFAKLKKWKV